MHSIITKAVFEQRREKVRQLLGVHNLSALFVCDAANRYYLSGFEMGDIHTYSIGGYVLITREGKDILFTDSRYEEAAYRIWDRENVVLYTSPARDIADYMSSMVTGSIGIEEYTMSIYLYRMLAEKNTLIPADTLIPQVRAIKEDREIKCGCKSSFLF